MMTPCSCHPPLQITHVPFPQLLAPPAAPLGLLRASLSTPACPRSLLCAPPDSVPTHLPSGYISLDRFSLTDRGMAMYSLCTDLVEMVVGEPCFTPPHSQQPLAPFPHGFTCIEAPSAPRHFALTNSLRLSPAARRAWGGEARPSALPASAAGVVSVGAARGFASAHPPIS